MDRRRPLAADADHRGHPGTRPGRSHGRMGGSMDPRILLMEAALRARAHSSELLLASRAALKNAEEIERVICNGSDAEVKATVRAVMS